jgi:PEGA domain
MLNNSSSQTTENGSLNANANSISIGDTTSTQVNGNYSGTRTTSTSGVSTPIYRVYDNLMIESSETVYVTSERLRWRWSKGAHVAVNETVKYYVDSRKLHILDNDGKEHVVAIVKEIRKPALHSDPVSAVQVAAKPIAQTIQVSVLFDSTPPGADIEIDGAFVGNTPSTVTVNPGSHDVAMKRKGFADWSKKLNVTGGSIHLNAELEMETAK